MTEHLNMKKVGGAFHIDIHMPLEPLKANEIATLVEKDAGESTVTIGRKKRLLDVIAIGFVSPLTMREIIRVLAR